MSRENMSWSEIETLAPHLRIIAENAKKRAILKKSGYKGDDELPNWINAIFAIVMLLGIIGVIWIIIAI